MFNIGRTIRSAKMNASTPPMLMPPFHSTAARGMFPTEQTKEMIATSGPTIGPAMSHCQIAHATNLLARWAHAAATTSCHVCMADALKTRCVLAEVRWRWTLKVLWAAACTEKNLCADPTLLNPCIYLRQPGETENVLRHGWLYTGDIAKMDAGGSDRMTASHSSETFRS